MKCKGIDEKFYYEKDDLGSVYTKKYTRFRVWAPTAANVELKLYEKGKGGNELGCHTMQKEKDGTWFIEIEGDLHGVYYTYLVTVDEQTNEVVDIYAKACGVNGKRGMVIDLTRTVPEGWDEDKKPPLEKTTDAIIYEVHVRDISADQTSGIKHVGKFLGLVEPGTKSPEGFSTGLDHMKELGITHVHILPVFDFCTVDEEDLETPQYNWGYDPLNYNVPEGSYSTDPFHGEVRIKELKQMVKAFHDNGIRVIMDVVYNHTYHTEDSYFNQTVPGYYYRMEDGEFTNGSGCGNETASEHKMMRKFIVDSVKYWATEYHIDGFRFDLMAVHDIDTMKEVRKQLDAIDKSIMLYGEGWTGGESGLDEKYSASKGNARKIPQIGMFSDITRDALRGHIFHDKQPGFVNGLFGTERKVKLVLVGGISHGEAKSIDRWAARPTQSINYVSAHDDLTIWDKLAYTNPRAVRDERMAMNKMAAAIVMLAQGTPFLNAGEEFLRTKPALEGPIEFDDNSYKSPDIVNSIKWNQKSENIEVFEYYKGLIEFRKAHPALRMTTNQQMERFIHFLRVDNLKVVSFLIDRPFEEESAEYIWGVFNSNTKEITVKAPKLDEKKGEPWIIYINGEKAGTTPLGEFNGKKLVVPSRTSIVMCK